jgi:hypothetical protein
LEVRGQEAAAGGGRPKLTLSALDGYNPDGSAGIAQLVERQPSKLNVAGSNPVPRSIAKTKDGSGYMISLSRHHPVKEADSYVRW